MFLWDRQKYQLLVQLFGDEGRNTYLCTREMHTYIIIRMTFTKHFTYDKREPLSPSDVKYYLSNLLGQRQTTIVPTLNNDGGTGHIDLYLDATDENKKSVPPVPLFGLTR